MLKIGIIYIATGLYIKFWEGFYESFSENFLPNSEKKWCVFTDSDNIYSEGENGVYKLKMEAKPWPLVTLLRFNTFLQAEELLKGMDYIFFFNANAYCNEEILEAEIIGDGTHELILAQHPGYIGKRPCNYAYDRSPCSLAYIPYSCGKVYVQGSLIGGKSEAFWTMTRCLKNRVESDLKRNVIALYHDESHLNRYICGKNNYRLLSVSYNFPEGFKFPKAELFEQKIIMRDKAKFFDVNAFKNVECAVNKTVFEQIRDRGSRAIQNILTKVWNCVCLVKDTVIRKKIENI